MGDKTEQAREELQRAVQNLLNAYTEEQVSSGHDHPHLLSTAVVLYEAVCVNDQGRIGYLVTYSTVTDSTPAATVGVMQTGMATMIRDMLGG